jgi:cytochrome o ubiquinol oxidase subunit II
MTKHRKKLHSMRPFWLISVGLMSLVLIIAVLLRGNDIALLTPMGQIANEQRRLLILCVVLLLEIAIPTLTLFFYTAWKYRESNEKATYSPDLPHKKMLVFSLWAAPTITMLLLASVMIPATHELAPQKSIDPSVKPLTIQVVAMRWKWLFIYPEQNIASVNFVQIPTNIPIQFEITADETPMSSFWIPHLAGQLYAMTGHANRLNLIAEKPGDYNGSSAEINGAGFAGMKFTARATTVDEFNNWVTGTKQSGAVLDANEYQKLLIPSQYNRAAFYATAGPDVYDTILMKYEGSHGQHMEHK